MTSIFTEDVDLFSETPFNTAEEQISWVEHRPCYYDKNGLSTVSFSIPGNATEYIDLGRTELYTRIKCIKEDGSPFADGESAVPINMILHTMWSGVDVYLNKTLVSSSGTHYMYKAAIECLLNNSKDTQRIQLAAIGMTVDERNFDARFGGDDKDRFGTEVGINNGMKHREAFYKDNTAEFMGPLLSDVCNQGKAILNAVDVDIKLTPNKDEFRIITNKDGIRCKLMIEEIYLLVCKILVAPGVMTGHTSALNIKNSKYPIQKTEVISYCIPERNQGDVIDNMFKGVIPSRLIIGLVPSAAFHGNYGLNPIKFEHFNITNISLIVNGKPTPKRPFYLDIPNNKYLDALLSLYRATGKSWIDTDIAIDRDNWKQGLALIAFDIDPTAAPDLRYKGIPKFGHMRLSLTFKEKLPESVEVIMYATFPGRIEIDQARVVTVLEPKDLLKEMLEDRSKRKITEFKS